MYTLARNRLPELFAKIGEILPLYLPVAGEAGVDFAAWQGDFAKVDLQTLKTTLSPKGFFLPATESLYSTILTDTEGGSEYKITPALSSDQPFALFGVRACDAAAVSILDSVYLSDPVDALYQARRQKACVITLACEKPGATCFCDTFNINPAQPGGDVSAWLTEDALFWQPHTEKGEALTAKLNSLLQPGEGDTRRPAVNSRPAGPEVPLPPVLSPHDNALPFFHSPAWDDLHVACIACGTCTFLCPTCQCYDIASHASGESVHCARHWDACLYPGFTQMAHGNPRPTKRERFRQRFMHKLVYHPQRHGAYACVGCGRCVAQCPVNMNIVKVAKALARENEVTQHV
ncbi:MAG: 4Fe-4S dicluster domain-containing protein [Defluviitaleaceae bacterium]|nr:4Fe-4S dicluster domain-containing protein [Defluviitaleaceae bacterium]